MYWQHGKTHLSAKDPDLLLGERVQVTSQAALLCICFHSIASSHSQLPREVEEEIQLPLWTAPGMDSKASNALASQMYPVLLSGFSGICLQAKNYVTMTQ